MGPSEAQFVSPFSSVAMSQKTGHLNENEEETGWIRTVHAHVQYNAGGKLPPWKSTRPQTYFLSQRQPLLDGTRSLQEIAIELARQNRSTSGPAAEALEELDAISRELVTTTRQLHAEQRQLGIVTRENVVWNGKQILLMDQGFYVAADVYPLPPWISNPPPDACLWEDDIRTQQAKALPSRKFEPAEDVRLLIRLFQGLLLNVWQRSLVTGEDLRKLHKTRSMHLWDSFLKLMVRSPPASLDDLERVLGAYPLAAHFRSSAGSASGGRPKSTASPAALLLLPVALTAALGATWHFQTWPFAPPQSLVTKPTEPAPMSEPVKLVIPPPPPLLGPETPITAQLDSLSGQVTSLQSLNDRLTAETSPAAEDDQRKIAEFRERFLSQWSISFPEALETFKLETTREAGYQMLNALRDHLRNVRQLTRIPSNDSVQIKERQCFELLQTLRFDLRLPAEFRQSLLP